MLLLSMETTDIINYGTSKFKNIMGITCYMNSILHILQHAPYFSAYISQAKFRDTLLKKLKNDNVEEFVIFELFRLFKTSLENDDGSITPSTFKKIIGEKNDMWNDISQQDSQEFFNFLISQIEEEIGTKCIFIPGLNVLKNSHILSLSDNLSIITASRSWIQYNHREYSPLKNLFDGMMSNMRTCTFCKTKTTRYEPFISLPVSIPTMDEVNIYNCLDHMILEEQLDKDNMKTCDFCGIKNKSHSQSLLWKTPKILVIHIKRFSALMNWKILTNVSYPTTNLDLSKYFHNASIYKNNSVYELFGVNCHHSAGNTSSGHYTSFVKSMIDNKWYHYNDANPIIAVKTDEHLQSSNTSLLFYVCRN